MRYDFDLTSGVAWMGSNIRCLCGHVFAMLNGSDVYIPHIIESVKKNNGLFLICPNCRSSNAISERQTALLQSHIVGDDISGKCQRSITESRKVLQQMAGLQQKQQQLFEESQILHHELTRTLVENWRIRTRLIPLLNTGTNEFKRIQRQLMTLG
jgi:hypothetical protein